MATLHTWDQSRPLYQQLADHLSAGLLDGDPPEGMAMPSVRALAGRYLLNPLTVNRALQSLDDDGLLELRRGIGFFVHSGARARLRQAERRRVLNHEWPQLRSRLQRLGIGPDDLDWKDEQ